MKNLKDKFEYIDLILDNEILMNEFILECENVQNECEIDSKLIKKKVKTKEIDYISALKVACFVGICVFLWEIGFSNMNLTYAKEESIIEKEKVSEFSSKFKEFTENFRVFERR